LIGGVLRLVLPGQVTQRVMLVLPLCESCGGLAHVFGMSLSVVAGFGADQHAVLGTQHAVAVSAQLKAIATRILATRVVFDAGNVAQRKLAVLVVALELRLNLLFGVVQDQVVAAPGCAVTAAGDQLAASKATECLLLGQAPGRHVDGVVGAAGDDGPLWVAAQKVDDYFFAYAGDVHGVKLVASNLAPGPNPAGAVLIVASISVPAELDLDAAKRIGVDVALCGVGAGA
jgi:hypothetical protein